MRDSRRNWVSELNQQALAPFCDLPKRRHRRGERARGREKHSRPKQKRCRKGSARNMTDKPLVSSPEDAAPRRTRTVHFAGLTLDAHLKRAVERVGQRWAEEVLTDLPKERRVGAWPGRMSEARAQLTGSVVPMLRQGGHWPAAHGTDFESAARLLNRVAKAVWSART
jgi:hypothetical protein